ncbi:MAG: 50S ribosomal protein L25/general stress protein Ctc [Methylococcales bacterium]
MSSVFEFVAESRNLSGKSAARAVRRDGNVPAIVYGGAATPQSIVLNHNEVAKHLSHEAVYSHILDLKVDGKVEKVVLKGLQRHPAKAKVMHMDFMRVDATHALKVNVPLHFMNEDECVGVKAGGVVMHAMVDVEVLCLPSALPEYIEVDLATIEIGQSLHLSDLILPEGVEILILAQGEDHDHPVAQVMKTKVKAEDEGEGEEVVDEADAESDEN